jgi:WD40 repeat protein
MRWLALCLVLSGGCFVAVAALTGDLFKIVRPTSANGGQAEKKADGAGREPVKPPAEREAEEKQPAAAIDERPVTVRPIEGASGSAQPQIVQDGRVMVVVRYDVPSERDGRLIGVATEILPGDPTPPPEKIIDAEIGMLVIRMAEGDTLRPGEKVIHGSRGERYRALRDDDKIEAKWVQVHREPVKLRRLEVGDKVQKGQLLALVNPILALDDLDVKRVKLEAAAADVRAATKTKEEAERRYASMTRQRAVARNSVSDEDYRGAKLTWDRYIEEELAKMAAEKQARRELLASLTQLKMHEIRASAGGVVKFLYKNSGDAVKNLDPVLQVQDPDWVRVEGQVDVQDAVDLRRRVKDLKDALRLKREGYTLWQSARDDAAKVTQARHMMDRADEQIARTAKRLQVVVEASRPEPAQLVLKGHLQEVTCVAVSKGANPFIVSGSEDHTVRLWKRESNDWVERWRLNHHAVVRTLACTGPRAPKNWLVTGTADGRVTRFDLDNLTGEELRFNDHHSGAVTCVAISPDGKLCATGGEDRTIRVWDVEDGKLRRKVSGAHTAAVTSVQFAPVFSPDGKKVLSLRLVSAGRDKRLVLWSVGEDDQVKREDFFERRSGDVSQLGVSPDGKRVLFDEGRELRVLSLKDEKIVGTLQNPPGAASFATLALFSPDGRTILTNGAAAGRLQLWRAPSPSSRAAELRQFLYNSSPANCAAFSPDGTFAVTGMQDTRVVVWGMPAAKETEKPLTGTLTYVEEFLDSGVKKVAVRAELRNPGWLIPGQTATLVIPPEPAK